MIGNDSPNYHIVNFVIPVNDPISCINNLSGIPDFKICIGPQNSAHCLTNNLNLPFYPPSQQFFVLVL